MPAGADLVLGHPHRLSYLESEHDKRERHAGAPAAGLLRVPGAQRTYAEEVRKNLQLVVGKKAVNPAGRVFLLNEEEM